VNLRPTKPDQPDINLTPLIDVVFLLLIFFMVSTTFKDDARLRLQLPQANGEPVAAEELDQLQIVIDAQGHFYIGERQLADARIGTLRDALRAAAGARHDLPVLIKADAKTPHQAVMTALDAAAQLGLTHIAFAASRGENGP
jgi:biopolymer transport protein ExbD